MKHSAHRKYNKPHPLRGGKQYPGNPVAGETSIRQICWAAGCVTPIEEGHFCPHHQFKPHPNEARLTGARA